MGKALYLLSVKVFNNKMITLNNTCYWSEVNNSSDISVDCVRYDNHSLCFNLKECILDCSNCCTKNFRAPFIEKIMLYESLSETGYSLNKKNKVPTAN